MWMRIFQPHCYSVRCCVAHGLHRSRFHSTRRKVRQYVMWCLATSYTRHQGEMWPLQMVTAAGRCSLSHRQKQKLAAWEPSVHWAKQFVHQNQIARIRTRLTCLLRVFFNRQSTIIEISPQLTKLREQLSKAWQKLPHGAVIANHHFYHLFIYG